ncbi:MAG: hypothetical protein ACNYPE_00735 [Candidatus Azotimanducaceae bacterium WSBS_2022_MAG_OTU7]
MTETPRGSIGTMATLGNVGQSWATLITGNEDGVKHCATNSLFSLLPIGYTVTPQADAGWVKQARPFYMWMRVSTNEGMIPRTATRLFLYGILCTWREC